MPRPFPLLVLLLLAGGPRPARALEGDRPRENNTYVATDENPRVLQWLGDARRAARARDWDAAADALHALLAADEEGVVAVRERELYTAPRRWAQWVLLAEAPPFPGEVLAAWRAAHDREGAGLLEAALARAVREGDRASEAAVLALLDRFPATTFAPRVVLALADRAIQRGDRDRAQGLLARSLEHVARSEEAAFRASPAYRRRAAYLAGSTPSRGPGWPTPGGDAGRGRTGEGIADERPLRLAWQLVLLPDVRGSGARLADPIEASERSPDLPFSAVADATRLYVHLGGEVAAIDREEGTLDFLVPSGSLPTADRVTNLSLASPGARAATVADGILYFNRVLYAFDGMPMPRTELVAWDLETRGPAWTVRPGRSPQRGTDLLDGPVFFRGAPAVRDGRLYVYGAAREFADEEPTRKEQAWLFCFDARTGRPIWRRFLASGDTDASPSLPPLSGTAPCVARGVVAVATGLGVAAALDAESGEILWILRHDRQPPRELDRLKDEYESKVYREQGWARAPARVVAGDLWFAPFDGDHHYRCWLRGSRRPIDGSFAVVQWAKHRAEHPGRNALLEHVAGVGAERVWYTGRRDPHHSVATYRAVLGHPVEDADGPILDATLPAVARDRETGAPVPPEPFGAPWIGGDVLYLPTRSALWRFALPAAGAAPGELAMLPPVDAPRLADDEEAEAPPGFGHLLTLDGRLYAVTRDRVLCYEPAR